MAKERNEEVTAIMETLTQNYFDNIGRKIAPDWTIYKADGQIIKSLIGAVTYRAEFIPYMEAQGYTFEE